MDLSTKTRSKLKLLGVVRTAFHKQQGDERRNAKNGVVRRFHVHKFELRGKVICAS